MFSLCAVNLQADGNCLCTTVNLLVMAFNLNAMTSNSRVVASNLGAMASNLRAIASNLFSQETGYLGRLRNISSVCLCVCHTLSLRDF